MIIVTNKIQCVRCKSIIESRHHYDFVQCTCKAVAVDGGHSYLRRCGEAEDIIELSEVIGETVALATDELTEVASLERLRAVPSVPNAHQLLTEAPAAMPSLAQLIEATLTAAARSTATRRTYQTAIGLFIQFIDQHQGSRLPDQFHAWRPFATQTTATRRTVWEFRAPAVVLRLVTQRLLEDFRAWREASGDGPNTASTRVYAVRTFLSIAQRDGVLTPEQTRSLGLRVYR